MRIDAVNVNEILDSRGEKTIKVTVKRGGFEASAEIPSGKSKGKKEAVAFGYEHAKKELDGGLSKEITSKEFEGIRDLDNFLIGYDASENKSKIGGDLSLGISISFARGIAMERGVELWQVLREEFFEGIKEEASPLIFSNMINGGSHAKNNLNIQEYQIVGASKDGAEKTVEDIKILYANLKNVLVERKEKENISFGDEQGYSSDFDNNLEPLTILGELIDNSGYENYYLGVDVAASSFAGGGKYFFEGKNINTDELMENYDEYFSKLSKLKFIEDPFSEDDEAGFKKFFSKHGKEKIIIGDDFTVTNKNLIDMYTRNSVNGAIIKPNQIGTVSETCDAMNAAKKNGAWRVVSHRSGEVLDPFLVHFAKAGGAEGIKIAVPVIKERISKFEEFVRLYK